MEKYEKQLDDIEKAEKERQEQQVKHEEELKQKNLIFSSNYLT